MAAEYRQLLRLSKKISEVASSETAAFVGKSVRDGFRTGRKLQNDAHRQHALSRANLAAVGLHHVVLNRKSKLYEVELLFYSHHFHTQTFQQVLVSGSHGYGNKYYKQQLESKFLSLSEDLEKSEHQSDES